MQLDNLTFPLGIVVGLSLMVFFALGGYYGMRYQRKPTGNKPAIATLYLAAYEKKSTNFLYNLIMLESPFIGLLTVGLLAANSDIISLVVSNWYNLIGLAVMAFIMLVSRPDSTDGYNDEMEDDSLEDLSTND